MRLIVKLIAFCLFFAFPFLCTTMLIAAEPYTIVLHQDQIFYTCNYEGTDPGIDIQNNPVTRTQVNGNQASAYISTRGNQAGQDVAAWTGFNFLVEGSSPALTAEITLSFNYSLSVAGQGWPGYVDPTHNGVGAALRVINSPPTSWDWRNTFCYYLSFLENPGEKSEQKEITFLAQLSPSQQYSLITYIDVGSCDNNDVLASVTVNWIKIRFPSYYKKSIDPYNSPTYYDYNPESPPVFQLRDFEHKSHQYSDKNCGESIRGLLPNVLFGCLGPESISGKYDEYKTTLTVNIAGVEIGKFEPPASHFVESDSEIPDRKSSLDLLSQVMVRLDPRTPLADGVATLTYSYNNKPLGTKIFNFKVKIPRFEGLYIFSQDADGFWDWEPYQGDLGEFSFIYLLIHGWQTEVYPNIMWMYDMALNMKTQSLDVPVLGWFWQKESYDPGITIIPGVLQASLIGAAPVSNNVAPEAQKLRNALIYDRKLNSTTKVHFIGHSFGGFMANLTLCSLLDFPHGIESAYDGVNFKLTLADVYHFLPTLPPSYNFTNRNGFLLAQGVEVENYISELGRTLDPKISTDIDIKSFPVLDKQKFNVYVRKELQKEFYYCQPDHGAAIWYYIDNKCWQKAWLPRKKYHYIPDTPIIHSISPLLIDNQ